MRATLIHNPTAGDGASPDRETPLARMRVAGYDTLYQSFKEKHWAATLDRPTDLIVIAGGDGTVARVVKVYQHDIEQPVTGIGG